MKPLALIALIVVTCMASTAHAANFEDRQPFRAGGAIEIQNVSGSVEVRGWNRNQIEVIAELDSDRDEVEFEISDDSAYVGIRMKRESRRKHGHHHGQDKAADILVRVPANTRVSANTVSADITVIGIEGEQRLEAVSGDIDTRLAHAEGAFRTVSGEIDVVGEAGKTRRVSAYSVSGDIVLENIGGEVRLTTVSGDVEATAGKFTRLTGETVSGDIEFAGDFESGGEIELESVNGDIDLRIPTLMNTDFDLESFNGSIAPLFGYKARRTSRYAPGRELRLTEGNGGSRIRIETLNGDIDIEASGPERGTPNVRASSATLKDDDDDDDDDWDWGDKDHDHDHEREERERKRD
ncbi:MAG: DUF4097 family beta strand repeat protein [Gammaproteobacteria bacterium]|nr:DUF4097 family beta strand repeat protein [Gammaproteobacteria bacterium]MBT8143172.1 DUF4097 family beta strand repeat protein [Gammaproteobacteria bacterium]